MTEIGLGHYLILGVVIFSIGIIGIFLNRKNVIVILMSIELIVFAMFVLTVAAAEAAIGLAIIVVYYRNKGTIRVEAINSLKG